MTFNCSAGDIGSLFPRGRGGGRKKSGSSFRARARVRARAGNAKRLGGPEAQRPRGSEE
jgi:hypothetical protein